MTDSTVERLGIPGLYDVHTHFLPPRVLAKVRADFLEESKGAFLRGLLPRLGQLRNRVLLGSDFPNIPYPCAHQVEALERLELGDAWLRAVLWDNAARLIGP